MHETVVVCVSENAGPYHRPEHPDTSVDAVLRLQMREYKGLVTA